MITVSFLIYSLKIFYKVKNDNVITATTVLFPLVSKLQYDELWSQRSRK